MADTPTPLWFRLAIAAGVLLAVLVLAQTVAGYWYLSRALLLGETHRNADRTVRALQTAIRFSSAREREDLGPVLDEFIGESEGRIAWISVRDLEGEIVATSQRDDHRSFSGEEVGQVADTREGRVKFDRAPARDTPGTSASAAPRDVVVALFPCRCLPVPLPVFPFAPRPSPTGGDDPAPASPPPSGVRQTIGPLPRRLFAEVAFYQDGIAAPFGRLRRTSIVNGSAALALLVALTIIGTRFQAYARGRRLETQLELARRVQSDLLPAAGERQPHAVEFAAECLPATHVGGDFYDVSPLENDRVVFVLGDVSGHGIAAALLMGLIHGSINTGARGGPAEEQERSMERLNELLLAKSSEERFASLFWCLYDPAHRHLRYINAGHVPPLLFRRHDEGSERFTLERLDQGGPVLGLLTSATYHEITVSVAPGDVLVVLSDGIVEATNARREEFGEQRVIDAIDASWEDSPDTMRDTVLRRVEAFSPGPRRDDQTLLVITLGAPASATGKPPLSLTA